MLRVSARALAPMVTRVFPRLMSGGATRVSFDGAERASLFRDIFEEGAPMWASMLKLAAKAKPASATNRILDLGCGPGEPACFFAANYSGASVLATDMAQSMVDLAKQRAEAKGLSNLECMLLDMQDQSPIADSSVDLVIGQMSYMFVPDKPLALAETFRVLKPGGVLVANVWKDINIADMAGGILEQVTGPPKGAPTGPNPMGPLSLSDASLFDGLLRDAGFELTGEHNFIGSVRFELGPATAEKTFKIAALPIWDKLDEFEADGTFPGAWASAKAAFPKISAPYTDSAGVVQADGSYRIAVVRKPA